MELHVLNLNLGITAIYDEFASLIWVNRYQNIGDCEVYVPATDENLQIFRMNYYLARPDDDMVCQIKKIEITTDPDEGNYLIVTGYDVKRLLDQRIVWDTINNNGTQEAFLRRLVSESMISPGDANRRMKKANSGSLVALGDLAGFEASSTEQVSYVQVGTKVRETCVKNGWGYRMPKKNGALAFELYAGVDRSNSVKFSAEFENIAETAYSDDETNLGNVALIGGEGEGSNRKMQTYGNSVGIYRSEKFVDANDTA